MNYFIEILISIFVHLPLTSAANADIDAHVAPVVITKADSVKPVKLKAGAALVQPALTAAEMIRSANAAKTVLGISKKGNAVEAWFFPGTSDKRALVIGGVHGSELSSIEVARQLINQLQNEKPYYSVVVIPCLFPDNAEQARSDRSTIGTANNTGRYTHHESADPNRQMPSLGKAFDESMPVDHIGRAIEVENQMLLSLINEFRPHRIANIHAIRDGKHAGIYADPRTDSKGNALGFASDSALAVSMAAQIDAQGGYVPGNRIADRPTALYYKDPVPAAPGQLQKRNTCGSQLPSGRGQGISLGSWASTAIENEEDTAANRPAMRIITIEFPGYKAPKHYADPKQQQICSRQVELYASAIMDIFLGDYYAENL